MTRDLRLHLPAARGSQPLPCSGLSCDSRELGVGDCFLALAGEEHHGGEFIASARQRGAAWVLVEQAELEHWRARYPEHAQALIGVDRLKHNRARLARSFYQQPDLSMTLVGVTGTNGKSSICHYLAQAWQGMGCASALIGTLGHGKPDAVLTANQLTTPEPVELYRLLAHYRASGIAKLCMEVSSHALKQGRVEGLSFDYALFSNLSQDHLDYHPSMADYARSKARLLRWPELKARIINHDDHRGRRWLRSRWAQDGRSLSVSSSGAPADLSARLVGFVGEQQLVELRAGGAGVQLKLPLVGAFNLSNAALSAACLCADGIELAAIAQALQSLRPVPGRMQRLWLEPEIIVDYAHTPDALANALASLRTNARGRPLWLVFGCGGERDRGKRAQMGSVAARYADVIIVTSDNPRGEDPERIMEDIYSSPQLRVHPQNLRYRDRDAAIGHAVLQAPRTAMILVAGKGHERYQIIGKSKKHFDDVEVALGYARRRPAE